MGLSDDRSNQLAALRSSVARSLRVLGSDIDRLDEAVADSLGLHRTDLRCLEIVSRMGPLTAGTLAELAGLSNSAVTSVIDRAERAGYLRRLSDASDRRRVLVEETDLGRRQGWAAFSGLMKGTDRVLARYSAEQLRLLEDFVEAVRAVLVEEAKAIGRPVAGGPERAHH